MGLAGAEQRNFEVLLRALVRHRWGRFGLLRDRLNQPGIEFHLQLQADCELGEAGRWFGWQCRYYKLLTTNKLGKTRRDDIKDAVEKARADVPGLTDFVLCLPRLPGKADLEWYDETLQTEAPEGITMHRWGPDDLEAEIEQGANVLRASFFGDLILTPEALAACHEQSVAPIRRRWVPNLHIVTHVERHLAEALLREDGSESVAAQAGVLGRLADDLAAAEQSMSGQDRSELLELTGDLRALAGQMFELVAAFEHQRPEVAAQLLAQARPPRLTVPQTKRLVSRIRALPSVAALAASTLVADVRRSLTMIAELRRLSAAPLLAVVGEAGRGKSQLGAQVTAAVGEQPAGVFIRGVELQRGARLDDLAARIPQLGLSSFAELLAGCDAAGARAGRRLPVVIDGLHEAHRPEDWADLLAQLTPSLNDYPNVKIILTYRGAIADTLRNEAITEIELDLAEVEVWQAVERYFEHFKIDPGDA